VREGRKELLDLLTKAQNTEGGEGIKAEEERGEKHRGRTVSI